MSDETNIAATAEGLLALTADIVSAHVGNNPVATDDLPALIKTVHAALAGIGASQDAAPAVQEPAVSVRASIKPDYLVCLEDGRKLKTLKRYLRTKFGMSPEDYRRKWNLPGDYPMVAPAYAEKRRALAYSIGLGRRKALAPEPVAAEAAPTPKAKRGRPPGNIEATAIEKPARKPRGKRAVSAKVEPVDA